MRPAGENGEPWNTSLALTPLDTSSLWAASMSETISPPLNEPGAADVTPLPNEIELPEPSDLYDAKIVSHNEIVVEPPSEPCVELLCTVDVRDGDERDLELHVDSRDTGVILLLFETADCLTHVIFLLLVI